MYNVEEIRKDFPVFADSLNGKPIIYLDTAASAQKPQCVIDKIANIYAHSYANVHRGNYTLAEMMTQEYESARETVASFIGAAAPSEIVFTGGATESINLVASAWAENNLKEGDEILVSQAEHHANLIPWQIVAQKTGAKLKVFEINDDGSYNRQAFEKLLTSRVKLVAVTAMSNVLGTIFPVRQMAACAHQNGAKILIDACQSIVHQKTDVQETDCDFLAFSAHKLYGPTGVGVLYVKKEILENMLPYQTGGDMVDKVTYEKTTYAEPPARFEAGTQAFVQTAGLAEAVKYVLKIGYENIFAHEQMLISYFNQKAFDLKGLKIIGTAKDKGGVFAFDFNGIHPQDLSFVLAHEGVCVRIGHHCAEPLVNRMGYNSLARISFGLYTTKTDIDAFFKALNKAQNFF